MKDNHLDLGCGSLPRNPYGRTNSWGVDVRGDVGSLGDKYRQCQIGFETLPFEDSFFSSVSAYDLIEHIPRVVYDFERKVVVNPFVSVMNEVWRVLDDEGLFLAITPVYPSPALFQDPTHVNFISVDTHTYFCGKEPYARAYGFVGRFEVVSVKHVIPHLLYTRAQSWKKRLRFLDCFIRMKGQLSHYMWELKANKG